MATYDINSLAIRDGKIYSGGVEVMPTDTLATYNQAATSEIPWLTGQAAPTVYTSLPAWSALQNFSSMIPDAPQRTEGSMFDVVNDPYAAARALIPQLGSVTQNYQVDPFLQFTNTGTNRNALYGADMVGADNTYIPYSVGDSGGSFFSPSGMPAGYIPLQGGFANNMSIPDLSQYTGGEYTNTNYWMQPASLQSSTEAQAILKQFFPGATQEQLDRAAYAALQSGDRYYGGPGTAPVQDTETWYYGHGPLPVVMGVAEQLGGVTPALQTFLNQNWAATAARYAAMREQAKAAASAEQMGHITSAIGGISTIVGGAFSFASLLGASGLSGGLSIMGPAMESGAMGTTAGLGAQGFSWSNVLENAGTGAIKGAIQGGIGSAVSGGDVGSGIISGAVRGGLTSGAASGVSGQAIDWGANPAVAGILGSAAGSATGGLINAVTQPDAPGAPGNAATAAPQAQPTIIGNDSLDWGGGFAIASGLGNAYGRPEWGSRLTHGRAA